MQLYPKTGCLGRAREKFLAELAFGLYLLGTTGREALGERCRLQIDSSLPLATLIEQKSFLKQFHFFFVVAIHAVQ